MLFMLIAGRTCCCGGANDGLPIPGFVALSAGNDEFSVFREWSGVTVLLCDLFTERLLVGGGDTGGVDQENVAAGDPLLADLERLVDGRDGSVVDADALAQGSPPNMSVPPLDDPPCPPRTSASKSVSPAPLLESRPLDTLGPPKLMNSLRVVAVELLAPSSCSLRVCSVSTRADMDLIRFMYAWN